MAPEVIAVIGLCAFLALWYAAAYWYNRRRGQHLSAWLEKGLDVLGGERRTGWLGSSATGARINVTDTPQPFQRMGITLLLESREILPIWLLSRLRGRRDWLIIKATLRIPSPGEVEIIPANGPLAKGMRREDKQPWKWQQGPYGLAIAYRGLNAGQQAAALMAWLETYGAYLDRLSWRKVDPHVQLQMRTADLITIPSETFLAALRTAVEQAAPARR